MPKLSDPIRWTNLRHMGRSPAHYRYAVEHPAEPTPAMRLGSLVHAHVLGGLERFVTFEGTRRGKVWEEFKALYDGQEIVTAEEQFLALSIAESVKANADAMAMLEGEHERQLSWSIAGRACQGRLDSIGDLFLTELKTTADASPDRFRWHALKMGYFGQLAWYRAALAAERLPIPPHVGIVAVEVKPPHVVSVFSIEQSALEIGERTWRLYFERVRVHESEDLWPGYFEGTAPLDAPEDEDLTLQLGGEEVSL